MNSRGAIGVRRGFSLVELLVVVSIVAVLLGAAVADVEAGEGGDTAGPCT